MENPFLKRATEHLREPAVFLGIVSPEPVRTFLAEYGRTGVLYDRLVLLRGTPGSGKTTLARLFDYSSLTTLLGNRDITTYRPLLAALTECGAIAQERPAVLACRLNMETNYRNIWELPYPEELRLGLTAALIQSRSVLSWIKSLKRAGVELSSVRIIPRSTAGAALEAAGGPNAGAMFERALTVETEMYRVVASLVPPPIDDLPAEIIAAYQPFDALEAFALSWPDRDATHLRPMVVLDDANVLHPDQLRLIERWLARRELSIARWTLSRLDILHLEKALEALSRSADREDLPGITAGRDTLDIMLQNIGESRREYRTQFRRMARDMASRYLAQMQLFHSRKIGNLAEMLSTEPVELTPSKLKQLEQSTDVAQRKLLISGRRREAIHQEVERYRPQGRELGKDVRLSMESILLHRYVNRIPQKGLFEEQDDPDPSRPLRADSSVHEGARIHLLHRFDRPYYSGIETLCDCGSENAEQFLHLAAILVEAIATRLIRSRPVLLDARVQNDLNGVFT